MSTDGKNGVAHEIPANGGTELRIFLADTQAIYRVGIAKIIGQQPDLSVVAQASSYADLMTQLESADPDVLIFEERLSPTPAEAVADLLRRSSAKVIVLTPEPNEQDTVDYLRSGARGIITRAISPELLVRCVRKVAAGELWLDNKSVNWVVNAYRSQSARVDSSHSPSNLTPKELVIVAGVTQGLRNKDIADRIGTTEQVIKNYLRKIYLKLGVADRLELALFCVHKRLLDAPRNGKSHAAAAASGGTDRDIAHME
jgi:two-component system, NarL family, nitrate/nitrite response regulator NarL